MSDSGAGGLNLRKSTLFLGKDPLYTPPTVDELKSVISSLGWNTSQVAENLGVVERQVRRWVAGESTIPFAPWSLLLTMAGEIRFEWGSESASDGTSRRIHRVVASSFVFGSVNADNIGKMMLAAETVGHEVNFGPVMTLSANGKVQRHFRPVMCDSSEQAQDIFNAYVDLSEECSSGDMFWQQLARF